MRRGIWESDIYWEQLFKKALETKASLTQLSIASNPHQMIYAEAWDPGRRRRLCQNSFYLKQAGPGIHSTSMDFPLPLFTSVN